MDHFLDTVTKALWNKNYPRTLIIFNINNMAEILSGILLLVFAFIFPRERDVIWGYIACGALIVTPILGTVIAVLNQEIYEWIIYFTHVITAFIIIPLYYCTMGTAYGAGIVMFVLTVVQSYVLIKNLPLEIITIALQNTLYCFLLIASFMYPKFFINYPGELEIQIPLFTVALSCMNVYLCILARIFVYVFKMDYERTMQLAESVETANAMDDLTGAYNKETGFDILQSAMNLAWNNNESLSIAIAEINIPEEVSENDKYVEDLIIVNTFDACRAVLSSSSTIARLDKNRFLLVLTECKNAYQVDPIINEINSHFNILLQASKIDKGSLSFGYATLLHGMTLKEFVSNAEKNVVTRRAAR